MLEVEVAGADKLRRLAQHIEAEGNKGLGRQMSAALKRASTPLQESLRAEYTKLPARGGYAGTFAKSLRFRTATRTGSRNASFRLLTFADGTSERRDITALEKGVLRHPVFGRSRNTRRGRVASPWAVTRIRGGYHKRGTDKAANKVESEMVKVLDELASNLVNKA